MMFNFSQLLVQNVIFKSYKGILFCGDKGMQWLDKEKRVETYIMHTSSEILEIFSSIP